MPPQKATTKKVSAKVGTQQKNVMRLFLGQPTEQEPLGGFPSRKNPLPVATGQSKMKSFFVEALPKKAPPKKAPPTRQPLAELMPETAAVAHQHKLRPRKAYRWGDQNKDEADDEPLQIDTAAHAHRHKPLARKGVNLTYEGVSPPKLQKLDIEDGLLEWLVVEFGQVGMDASGAGNFPVKNMVMPFHGLTWGGEFCLHEKAESDGVSSLCRVCRLLQKCLGCEKTRDGNGHSLYCEACRLLIKCLGCKKNRDGDGHSLYCEACRLLIKCLGCKKNRDGDGHDPFCSACQKLELCKTCGAVSNQAGQNKCGKCLYAARKAKAAVEVKKCTTCFMMDRATGQTKCQKCLNEKRRSLT